MKKLTFEDILNANDKLNSEHKRFSDDAAKMMAVVVEKFDPDCAERLRTDGLPKMVMCGSMVFNSMYSSLNTLTEVKLAEHQDPGFIAMIWDKKNDT